MNDNEGWGGDIAEEQLNLFFWLGADGEVEELDGEEFTQKVELVEKEREDFLNVR